MLVSGLVLVLCAGNARAGGFSVRNYQPSLFGKGSGVLLDASPLGQFRYRVDFTLSYARNPLEYGNEDIRGEAIVDNLYSGDLTAGFGLAPFLDVGLSVPFSMMSGYQAIGSDTPESANGMGDVRLGIRAVLFDEEEFPVRLALSPSLSFPTGDEEKFLGEGSFAGQFLTVLEARYQKYRVLLNLGYSIQGSDELINLSIDEQFFWGIGFRSLHFGEKLGVEGEIFGRSLAARPFSEQVLTPVEANIGFRYHAGRGWFLKVGGGGGITRGIGSPEFRALLGIQYAFLGARDRDGDGVPDKDDFCPRDAEDRDGFQDVDGCPDPDNDEDGIRDWNDRCPNEPENFNRYMDDDGCPDPDPTSTIVGYVVDKERRPIGARIVIEHPLREIELYSDPRTGKFEAKLQPGDFSVKVTAEGYETGNFRVSLQKNQTLKVLFRLKESMWVR